MFIFCKCFLQFSRFFIFFYCPAISCPSFKEMLHIVSRLLGSGAHLVKGITFDAHMSHAYFKEALFGYFETAKKEELPLSELPFFCEVEYIPLPSHALPRLPMNLCRYKGEFIWPLPGSCPLDLTGFHFWGSWIVYKIVAHIGSQRAPSIKLVIAHSGPGLFFTRFYYFTSIIVVLVLSLLDTSRSFQNLLEFTCMIL